MAIKRNKVLMEVSGKPVHIWVGNLSSSRWGYTRLELLPTRVIESTKFIVRERNCELLLSSVQGAEMITSGNATFLALTFALLPLFGLGLLFLIPYFLFKHKFLVIHGMFVTVHVAVKGDPEPFLDFMDAVILEAEKAKAAFRGGSDSKASSDEGSQRDDFLDKAPPPTNPGFVRAVCPTCNMEYQVPVSGAGKRYSCQNCKGLFQAPMA